MIKMLRKANAIVTCVTLTYATMPTDAVAFTDVDRKVQKNSDFTSTALGVMQNLQNFAQQYQQPQMTQAQMETMQTFQRFQNSAQQNLSANQMGTNRHYIFQNCMVPPDKGLRPVGLCTSSAVDPTIMASSMKIAQDYINMYDQHLRPQNTSGAIGRQCIQNSLKSLGDQAKSMLEDFDKMILDFEKQSKDLENQLQMKRKDIQEEYALLNGTGSGGKSTIDSKNVDYRKLFPKECTDIMGTGNLSNLGKGKGLLGIRDALASTDENAGNFRGPALKNVRRQIDKDKALLQKRIKDKGISGLSGNAVFTGIQFKNVFKKAMTDHLTPITEDVQRANALLSQLGVTDQIPSYNDPSFEIKLDTVINRDRKSVV